MLVKTDFYMILVKICNCPFFSTFLIVNAAFQISRLLTFCIIKYRPRFPAFLVPDNFYIAYRLTIGTRGVFLAS